MPDLELATSKLHLDLHNPRHRPVEDEAAALAELVRRAPGKMIRLAVDISERGLNPMDRLLVMGSGSEYVVLEGNRRVAALRLLADPDLSPDRAVTARLKELPPSTKLPKVIKCVSVKDREEAQPWLDRRHGGEMDGAGILRWSAMQRSRNASSLGHQERAALVTLEWVDVKSAAGANQHLSDLLDEVAEEKFTTFGRLAGDPVFRAYAGFDLTADGLTPTDSEPQILARIARVLEDFRDGMTVSDLKNKEQRQSYVDQLRQTLPGADNPAPSSTGGTGATSTSSGPSSGSSGGNGGSGSSGGSAGTTGTSASGRKASTSRRPRPNRLFHGLRMDPYSPRFRDILHEVQQIDTAKFPNSASALIRMVIELATHETYDRARVARPAKDSLLSLVQGMLNVIDPTKKDKDYKDLRNQLSNPNSLIGSGTLNAFLHQSNFHPTPTEMRDISDKYVPYLEAMCGLVVAAQATP